MEVPQQLVLSMESVWVHAKADRHLLQVLEATGDYSRTARGAILIFLLMQITHSASPVSDKVGVLNPLTQYVQFLPPQIPLPTFWNDVERACIAGTSLEVALQSKLRSLDKEFTQLREATLSVDWCQHHWWSGKLSFEDWKRIDAMYRSRALDLPGTGHAMVPCIDMANHASGDDTIALYDTLPDGTAVLALREGKQLMLGDEVTITYGDEKGACEMLFSYGFLEDVMSSARELFLELDVPDDDPLKLAKKAVSKSAPGFRLFQNGDSVDWESDFIWLLCVNEEDGLRFRLLQTLDGVKELRVFWKETEITDAAAIKDILQQEPRWDVFRLRANTILQHRVSEQLLSLDSSSEYIRKASELQIDSPVLENITRLRDLESSLMVRAYEMFEGKVFNIHYVETRTFANVHKLAKRATCVQGCARVSWLADHPRYGCD
ncbi:MAG: hypothetical protein LQ342_001993 [Letrouitia transgressa]|nr:MAG: hypothetical protein LQ342_001993 [Letrouitia transgressa]